MEHPMEQHCASLHVTPLSVPELPIILNNKGEYGNLNKKYNSYRVSAPLSPSKRRCLEVQWDYNSCSTNEKSGKRKKFCAVVPQNVSTPDPISSPNTIKSREDIKACQPPIPNWSKTTEGRTDSLNSENLRKPSSSASTTSDFLALDESHDTSFASSQNSRPHNIFFHSQLAPNLSHVATHDMNRLESTSNGSLNSCSIFQNTNSIPFFSNERWTCNQTSRQSEPIRSLSLDSAAGLSPSMSNHVGSEPLNCSPHDYGVKHHSKTLNTLEHFQSDFSNIASCNSLVISEINRLESDLALSLNSLKILLEKCTIGSSPPSISLCHMNEYSRSIFSNPIFVSRVEEEINLLERYLGIPFKVSTFFVSNDRKNVNDCHNLVSPIGEKISDMNRCRSWPEYYEKLGRSALSKMKRSIKSLIRSADFNPETCSSMVNEDTEAREARRWIRLLDFQSYLRAQATFYNHIISPCEGKSVSDVWQESYFYGVTQLPLLLTITSKEARRSKFFAECRAKAQETFKELEERKRARTDFVKDILKHRVRFADFHARVLKIAKRLSHATTKVVLTSLEKRNMLNLSVSDIQFSKERMAALKAKDEVQYMKLLRETKNHRLLELVHQTEEYMNKLGHLVTRHREMEQLKYRSSLSGQQYDANLATPGESSTQAQDCNKPSEKSTQMEENGTPYDALIAAKNHYFTLTHTIQEDIVKIPSCLVGGELREYQLKGLAWMVSLYNNNLNGILADAMGLGKTIQTIALLAYLYEFKRNKGPFLIVAPLSTLHSGWNTELERWLPSFVKVVYDGSKDVRRSLRQKYFSDCSFNVLLTTDSFIMKDCTYLRKIHWEYLIVDEAHRLKNPKSKLVQVLTDKRQSRGFRIKRRLALTGTPLQNDLQEVWSLLNFLMPAIFSSSETFRSWFNAPLGQAGSQHQVEITEEEQLLVVDRLHKVLRPFLLRREKKEVENEVPRKHEEVLWCPMSGVQKRLYRDIEQGDISADVSFSSNTLMQLRKVCNHPYLFCLKSSVGLEIPTDESVIRLCGKFWVLDDILPKLQAAGHRVLIFSQMVKLLNILEIFLSLRGWRFLRLDGSTSSEERLRRLSLFNAPDSPYFIFALSTRAGGLGVNLQSADTVIIYDSDWNPQNDEQAQSRAHRIGQTKEVLILRLVTADTVEERILSAAAVKLDRDALVIKSGMFYDSGNDLEDERRSRVRAILSKKNKKQEITFYRREIVNRTLARSKEEREIFSRLDRLRQALGFGGLIRLSTLPSCLLKMERNSLQPGENWKSVYGKDCPWSIKQRGACPYSLPPDAVVLKRAAINDAVLDAVEFVRSQAYFGSEPSDAEPFLNLPDSTEYSGYQDIIEQPMCLNFIKTFAIRRNFSSLVQLEKYLSRISSNCRRFNGSDHYLFYQVLRLTGSILYRAREVCCRNVAAMELQFGWRTKNDVQHLYKVLDDISLLSHGMVFCGSILEREFEEEDDDDEEEDEEEEDCTRVDELMHENS